MGDMSPGRIILDIGPGAGFDMMVASHLTGESGRVYGIDLTEEMVATSKINLSKTCKQNYEVTHVHSENIPYDDNFFDVVISNGVINLSPCKQELFKEIYRVLKPGGVLQFADVMLENELPAGMSGSVEAWSQ